MTAPCGIRPLLVLLSLVGILAAGACSDRPTPTEVPAYSATPAPTPITGQAASLSGKITGYGPIESATVECEGRKTSVAPDGTYSLPDLVSGVSYATATYSYVTSKGILTTESQSQYLVLKPGANTQDFVVY